MSKRRKRNSGRHSGGGRVTPKGTRPAGQRPGDRSPTGSSVGGIGGVDPNDLLGSNDPGFDDIVEDLFDLGPDDDVEFDLGDDPLATLVEGFLSLDLSDPLTVELWAGEFVGGFRDTLTPATPWDATRTCPRSTSSWRA